MLEVPTLRLCEPPYYRGFFKSKLFSCISPSVGLI